VSLKGAGTVVELVPPSLDFGRVQPGPGGATLTTTLTNTGSTALGISGITVSGAGFSQTNNCPSSLGAGKSCAISVTFRPPGFAGFTGMVQVYDNGGGSPQQVPLSGVGVFR
jgi:hypothetical protein